MRGGGWRIEYGRRTRSMRISSAAAERPVRLAEAAHALRVLLVSLFIAMLLVGCSSLAPRATLAPTHVRADALDSPLGRSVAQAEISAPEGHSGFRLLPDAAFALDARLELSRRATRSLDVQYYLFRCDALGTQILRELRSAAARGVMVRMIVDDLHIERDDELFFAFAALPNVEVRLFNPLAARSGGPLSRVLRSLPDVLRINHRMHNKLFIADNSLSISGGRNIGQEYFMQDERANFIDVDILAAGPVVREQSRAFDLYWNSAQAFPVQSVVVPPVDESAARHFDELAAVPALAMPSQTEDPLGRGPVSHELAAGKLDLIWAPAQVYVDDPAKVTRPTTQERFAGSVTERTLAVISAAQSSVFIVSPYFIPGNVGLSIMQDASQRGVTTTVLTNSLGATDEAVVHFAYARYRPKMLALGVRLYEMSPVLSRRLTKLGNFGRSQGRLHAKVAFIDGRRIFVGSMNLDGRSASLNTEIGLLIDSQELVSDFRRLMDGDRFRGAYELRLDPRGELLWVAHASDGTETATPFEPGAGLLPLQRLLAPLLPEELL